jgi:hypothetical protein
MEGELMKTFALPLAALLALSACGSNDEPAAEASAEAAPAEVASAPAAAGQLTVDFGDDNGDWANDNECDDSRFEGPGMTTTPLLEEDIGHDATDCRTAYEAGRLTLRGVSTGAAAPAAVAAPAAAPAKDETALAK